MRYGNEVRCAALLVLAGAAPQPRWMTVGVRADGSPIEVNAAAIGPVGRLTHGWWRVRLLRPRGDGTAIEAHLAAMDCVRGSSATIETLTTRLDGSVLRDERTQRTTVPGSAEAIAARAICQLRLGRRPR